MWSSIIRCRRDTDPDEISWVLFAMIYHSPCLWSQEDVNPRLFSCSAVELDFFFCWRILCWTFARFSKPINVCFLSWGIVGFHIMDSSTALTAINSQISNWSSSSLQIILSAASNVQIVLWIRYTSNNCNGTNQSNNWLLVWPPPSWKFPYFFFNPSLSPF